MLFRNKSFKYHCYCLLPGVNILSPMPAMNEYRLGKLDLRKGHPGNIAVLHGVTRALVPGGLAPWDDCGK